ncbi:HET-domain-containing protein [Setomelanomma holmii]|uniref:HET-domain-containing protein n=1 Tax=Setomelanomma holmii TaxID=210430 RepID=A0A9P4LPR3_9PLEO|nr:HET-domain-containing protein [Setomelanomma holmii]
MLIGRLLRRILSRSIRIFKSDDSDTVATISSWLTQCIPSHCIWGPSDVEDSRMPTRLIHVGHGEGDGQHSAPYVTLTHRWGNSITLDRMNLTTERLSQYEERIPIGDLSQYVQDAMWLTRRLGFEYLWIDFICIVQDSDEDWGTEASLTSLLYIDIAHFV